MKLSHRGHNRRTSNRSKSKAQYSRKMAPTYLLFILSGICIFIFIYFGQQMDAITENEVYLSADSAPAGVTSFYDSGSNDKNEKRSLFFMPRQKMIFSKLESQYTLNPEKYDAIMKETVGEPRMIAYFSPWCGHCQHFIPVFIKSANRHQYNITLQNPSQMISTNRFLQNSSIVFGTVDCDAQRNICFNLKIEAYPTVECKNFPSDPRSMRPEGTRLLGDPSVVESYLKKHYPKGGGSGGVKSGGGGSQFYDQSSTAHLDVNSDSGDKNDKNNKNDEGDVSDKSEKGDKSDDKDGLKQWISMTKHSAARHAVPEKRLGDALMSLNYLIAEESFQAFNDAKRKTLQELLTMIVALLPTQMTHVVTEYRNILLRLKRHEEIDQNEEIWGIAMIFKYIGFGKESIQQEKEKKKLELDILILHDDIQQIIEKINTKITGNKTPQWFACGQIHKKEDPKKRHKYIQDGKLQNGKIQNGKIQNRKGKHRGVAKGIEPTTPNLGVITGFKLWGGKTGVKRGGAGGEGEAGGERALSSKYEGKKEGEKGGGNTRAGEIDGTTLSTPSVGTALERSVTRGGDESETSSLSPFSPSLSPSTLPSVGSAEGYTCGLWLLLHYITVAGSEQQSAKPYNDKSVITTTVILRNFRSFVSDLFGCSECKLNFLKTFDGCKYGRCEIGTYDFDALQDWLIDVHNMVTLDVYDSRRQDSSDGISKIGDNGNSSKSVNSAKMSKTGISDKLLKDILYPSFSSCPHCWSNKGEKEEKEEKEKKEREEKEEKKRKIEGVIERKRAQEVINDMKGKGIDVKQVIENNMKSRNINMGNNAKNSSNNNININNNITNEARYLNKLNKKETREHIKFSYWNPKWSLLGKSNNKDNIENHIEDHVSNANTNNIRKNAIT